MHSPPFNKRIRVRILFGVQCFIMMIIFWNDNQNRINLYFQGRLDCFRHPLFTLFVCLKEFINTDKIQILNGRKLSEYIWTLENYYDIDNKENSNGRRWILFWSTSFYITSFRTQLYWKYIHVKKICETEVNF